MASSRLPSFRSLFRGYTRHIQPQYQQRRWAQVHDVRFLATHHTSQQVKERYREKLTRKAKEEGHESIEALEQAYRDKIEEYKRKSDTVTLPGAQAKESGSSESGKGAPSTISKPLSPISDAVRQATKSSIKPLSSYLNIEKILELPTKEIEVLWRLRHANNPRSICAVIPLDTYQRMAEVARQHPQFILPLPRETTTATENSDSEKNAEQQNKEQNQVGADIHFLQWGFHPPASPSPASKSGTTHNTHTSTIVFTHLAAYKLHGEFAQPHTTITHHLDLADEKGLVLMHGQVMPDCGVSVSEASWLVSCVQRFYDHKGEGGGRKGELLRMFTRGDVEGFRVHELMDETERIS
ncbi:hypothetical protein VTN49DRAFT_6306 [Thermomyces lanuginosus]|uniref:uncharacterized protein n=1 Tax=Thermomyces lanuginosus TaxID=5541 RepID=UPI0037439F7F